MLMCDKKRRATASEWKKRSDTMGKNAFEMNNILKVAFIQKVQFVFQISKTPELEIQISRQ